MLLRRFAFIVAAAVITAIALAVPARADAAADLAALKALMARIEAMPGWTVTAQSTGVEAGQAVARSLTITYEDGPVSVSAASVRLSGMTAVTLENLEIERVVVTAPGVSVSAATISMAGMDWSSPAHQALLTALFATGPPVAPQRAALDAVASMLLSVNPAVGRFSLTDAAIIADQSLVAAVGLITSRRERNDAEAITARATMSDFVLLPGASAGAAPGVIPDPDEEEVSIAFDGVSTLDRKTGTLSLSTSVVAKDLGKFSLDLAISGVTDDAIAAIASAFSAREDTEAEAAALAAALDRTRLTMLTMLYEDDSLVRDWIEATAQQQGKPVSTLASDLANGAGASLHTADPALAEAVDNALAAFLSNPGLIELSVRPPQPPGLGGIATGKLADGVRGLGVGIRSNFERKL